MKYQSVDENCADSSTAQPTARTTLPVARPAWSGTEAWRCCCWSSQWFDGCLEVQPRLEEAPTIWWEKRGHQPEKNMPNIQRTSLTTTYPYLSVCVLANRFGPQNFKIRLKGLVDFSSFLPFNNFNNSFSGNSWKQHLRTSGNMFCWKPHLPRMNIPNVGATRHRSRAWTANVHRAIPVPRLAGLK